MSSPPGEKPKPQPQPQPIDALQLEIRGEMAASLGRTAERLEQRLAELGVIRGEILGLEGAERVRRVAAYHRLLEEAQEYRWYLMVQREAMGLHHHDALLRLYPLPPRLR